MALVARQRNDLDGAVTWLTKAIAANKLAAEYHYLLGNLYQDQGKIDRAMSSYRRAISLRPDYAEAHNDLGTAYFAKHLFTEAIASYQETIRLKPDHGVAHANLGAALRSAGRLAESRRAYQRALKLKVAGALQRAFGFRAAPGKEPAALPHPATGAPDSAELARLAVERRAGNLAGALAIAENYAGARPADPAAQRLLGQILLESGFAARAIQPLSAAVALGDASGQAAHELGEAYRQIGQPAEALRWFDRAVNLDSTLIAAHIGLVSALVELEQAEQAEGRCRQALLVSAAMPALHYLMAQALRLQERHAEALTSVRKAQTLDPGNADAFVLEGLIHLHDRDDVPAASQALERARMLAPNQPRVIVSLGLVEQARGRIDEALSLFHLAQQIRPDDVAANISESTALLLAGDFENGWRKYAWRARVLPGAGGISAGASTLWDGSSLAGRSILLYREQGLGDELLFSSCVPDIASQAAKTYLACDFRLVAIFRRSFPGVEIIGIEPAKAPLRLRARRRPTSARRSARCRFICGAAPRIFPRGRAISARIPGGSRSGRSVSRAGPGNERRYLLEGRHAGHLEKRPFADPRTPAADPRPQGCALGQPAVRRLARGTRGILEGPPCSDSPF